MDYVECESMKSIEEIAEIVPELNEFEGRPDARLSELLALLQSKGIELMIVPSDLVEDFEGVLSGRLFVDVSDTVENSWREELDKLKDENY